MCLSFTFIHTARLKASCFYFVSLHARFPRVVVFSQLPRACVCVLPAPLQPFHPHCQNELVVFSMCRSSKLDQRVQLKSHSTPFGEHVCFSLGAKRVCLSSPATWSPLPSCESSFVCFLSGMVLMCVPVVLLVDPVTLSWTPLLVLRLLCCPSRLVCPRVCRQRYILYESTSVCPCSLVTPSFAKTFTSSELNRDRKPTEKRATLGGVCENNNPCIAS